MSKPLQERSVIAKGLYWIMDFIEECVPDRGEQDWNDVPKIQFWVLEFPLQCFAAFLLWVDFQIEKFNL
jgi:hypothetical protein